MKELTTAQSWFLLWLGGVALFAVTIPLRRSPPLRYRCLEMISLFVLSSLVAPVCEETIFRGFLFAVFAQTTGTIWGLTFSGFLFAIFHAEFWKNGRQFLMCLLFSMAMGFARVATGTVLASVLLHSGFNVALQAYSQRHHFWNSAPPPAVDDRHRRNMEFFWYRTSAQRDETRTRRIFGKTRRSGHSLCSFGRPLAGRRPNTQPARARTRKHRYSRGRGVLLLFGPRRVSLGVSEQRDPTHAQTPNSKTRSSRPKCRFTRRFSDCNSSDHWFAENSVIKYAACAHTFRSELWREKRATPCGEPLFWG